MKKLLIVAILASSLSGDCSFWFKKWKTQVNYITLLHEDDEFEQLKIELPIGIEYSRRVMACNSSKKVVEAVRETRTMFKIWLDTLEGR